MTANVNVNPSNYWVNSDGLLVKYPGVDNVMGLGGEFVGENSSMRMCEFVVGYVNAALGTDSTHEFVLDYDLVLPVGAFIEKAEFVVTAPWDSASNDVTLSFGLLQLSDFVTLYSTTGIASAIPQSVMIDPGSITRMNSEGSSPDESTYAGTAIGVKLTQNVLVTVWWANHAPSQGAGILRVWYAMPTVDVGAV